MTARRVVGVAIGILMAAGSAVSAPTAVAASTPTSAETKFIASVVPAAQAAQKSFGIPAAVSIAQAIQESDWGTSSAAKNAKNYFNQRCSATMTAAEFRTLAVAQLGKPYVLGAEAAVTNTNPSRFDCSELVEWLYARSNNPIGDLAASQYDRTKSISGSVRPGDLVFLRNNPARWNGIGHVAVITRKLSNGDWEIVEARGRAYGVVKMTLSYWKTRKYFTGVRRFAKLVFAGDEGVVKVSTANLYQSGCVTISGVKYSSYTSATRAFADRAAHLAKDSDYKAARAKLPDIGAFIDELAKIDRPKDASSYAKKLKALIADYKLLDHNVVPFTIVLAKGARGAKVTALQHLLLQSGLTVKASGSYDSATIAAVKAFQKKKKLEVDGEAGPMTLGALIADLSLGATGNRVSALGALLTAAGYPASGSSFTKTTAAAVTGFQAASGLSGTGVATKNTWAKLFMAVEGVAPSISGTAVVDSTLTAATTGWGPGTLEYAYQWYRAGVAIKGATTPTYTLTPDDLGAAISVAVAGAKPSWTTVRLTSAATAAVAPAKLAATPTPTVAGKAAAGETLTATPGTWKPEPVSLAFQWNRGKTPIKGATAATYTLTGDDVGAKVTVTVTGSRAGYTSAATTSAATDEVAAGTMTPATPTISGTATVGATLTAAPGSWQPGDATLSYQWLRGREPIKNATAATYVVTPDDLEKPLAVAVTGKRAGFKTAAETSKPTAAVKVGTFPKPGASITGVLRVGNRLTAAPGTWGPGTIKYGFQWKRDGKAITGATATSYVLTAADIAATLTVTITGSSPGYETAAVTSRATAKVAAGYITNARATISGTPKVGKTVAAARGTWGPGKVTYRYQWYRNGTAIKSATAKTYKLTSADRGKTITVRVRGTLAGYATKDKKASIKVG